jgi:Tfp pilus assembly protein PilN
VRAVNLIPHEQRSGGAVGARSQGAAFAVLALLAGAAILTFMYALADHQLESRRAEAARLNTRAERVQSEAAQLASYVNFAQMGEQRLQAISTLIGSRFAWSAAMGELSRVLPDSVALSSLQGTIGSGTGSAKSSAASTSSASSSAVVSSATAPGETPAFTLSGCATSQTEVAQMLVRLRLVSGVSNVTLQSSSKGGSGAGGGGAVGASAGTCPSEDPSFTAQVSFQPLPQQPATSTEALESAVSLEGDGGSKDRDVSGGAKSGGTSSGAKARDVSGGSKARGVSTGTKASGASGGAKAAELSHDTSGARR